MKPTILFLCMSLSTTDVPDFRINNAPFWYQKRIFFLEDHFLFCQEYINECKEMDEQFDAICSSYNYEDEDD